MKRKLICFMKQHSRNLSENDIYIVDTTEYFCMEIDTEEDLIGC